jgi:DNA-binding phage protein
MVAELIREAIRAGGMSRYAISKATGIDQGQLCRFMQGQPGGLSFESVDKVLDALGLEIVIRPKSTRKGE